MDNWESYWKNKAVLVTGNRGFVGQNMIPRLKELGAIIYTPSCMHDLRIQDDVLSLYKDYDPDVVIHLAARVGGIGANMINPAPFFYDNMMMGMNLIHNFRGEKFVQIGTVCSYPATPPIPFSENDLWNGYPEETNAPYGIAKRTLHTMLYAYYEQYDRSSVYVIPTNMYGPYDNFDDNTSHVIPAMIKKIINARNNNTDVTLWGTGRVSREFLYVTDAVEGILMAGAKMNVPMAINLGSGREIKICDLASLIAKEVGFTGNINFDMGHPDGQLRRQLNNYRCELLLGWYPSVTLEDGIRRTIKYYESTQN